MKMGPLRLGLFALLLLAVSASANVESVPGQTTPIPLDVAVVTTGGTAVQAVNPGNRLRGGWLQNPIGATAALCVNEIGVASGTTSNGNTTCIAAGQSYAFTPGSGAVSVISSDSNHVFSGIGTTP
jgi:hypothetical protein